eukprot:4636784-Amphidinium_carterae.1
MTSTYHANQDSHYSLQELWWNKRALRYQNPSNYPQSRTDILCPMRAEFTDTIFWKKDWLRTAKLPFTTGERQNPQCSWIRPAEEFLLRGMLTAACALGEC